MSTDELLLEWGRWARSELPTRVGPDGVAVAPFPAYVEWRPVNEREPGWGDYDAIPEPMLEPVDEQRCQQTDMQIMFLPTRYVMTIKRAYYNLRPVGWEELGEARRAFADLLSGTVRRAA